MSQKRKSDATYDSLKSESKRQRTSPVQLSLHRFFKASTPGIPDSCGSTKHVITPEYFGIHVYSAAEVEAAEGLEKAYRILE